MRRFVVAAVLIVAFSTGASAAEYFVAQDATTKKCGITKVKPDGKTAIMIGTASYKTKDEAKAARKTATECPGPKGAKAN